MFKNNSTLGRVSLGFLIVFSLVFLVGIVTNFSKMEPSKVAADTATTSVTVLNTSPEWTTDAQEAAESSGASPTNVGTNVSWNGTATDPNSESYYLLVCKTSGQPTPNAGAVPICNGGASNQWAVSGLTNSGTQATASYAAQASNPENNDWYAWICDGNAFSPKCNLTYKQGTGNTASPFVVNHRPSFTLYTDDSAKEPGELVTWNATAGDSDIEGGNDTVKLFVCKANDFNGTACGAGGTYCESGLVASDPTCGFTLENPKQDQNYTAYGFVIDSHNLAAQGGSQGSNSVLTVSNSVPTISAATVQLLDTDEAGSLALTTENGQTNGFKVKFTVTDKNSCQNASAGYELASARANVYRSGVGMASCQAGGSYNANNCYPFAVGGATWNVTCTRDAGTCSGAADASEEWTCIFPLWYLADPTDGSGPSDTQYYDQDWKASVDATDDNSQTSSLIEGTSGNELFSFLAYSLNTPSISYGSHEPGNGSANLDQVTTIAATGNVGLDENLYGDDMCTSYPTCSGQPNNTIFVNNQKYALSSVAYGSGTALSTNPGAEVEVNVNKTTVAGSPQTKNTFWGIFVPGAITIAGDYTGVNTIMGVKGEATEW